MEKYTTQMDAAGKGIVTPQMKNVLANEPISEQDLLEKVAKGEHQMALFGWSGNTGEAMDWLFFLLTIRSTRIPALNIAFWKNQAFTDLIDKAKGTLDTEERIRLYQKAQEVFHAEMPWVPLAHSLAIVPAQKSVKGFKVDPNGQRRYLRTWLD